MAANSLETQLKLEDAAIDLIERDGILAGLNLRAAADAAGVNRGNVYHYFGSRRQLLQAALRRRLQANAASVSLRQGLPLLEWVSWAQRYLLKPNNEQLVRLTMLLLLDRDESVQLMPFQVMNVQKFTLDQERGVIDADIDVVALNAFMVAAMRGYVLHREALVRETGIDGRELDKKVESLLIRFASSISGSADVKES